VSGEHIGGSAVQSACIPPHAGTGHRDDDGAGGLRFGESVEAYPAAQPLPCRLLLHETADGPLHVVVAEDAAEHAIIVVTVYRPDSGRWHEGFRRRR